MLSSPPDSKSRLVKDHATSPFPSIDVIEQPTVTENELYGWYAYALATEPFGVVALALFAPLILESLASASAVQASDGQTPCDTSLSGGYQCVVEIYGVWFDTSSVPLFVNSVSVFVQAVLFIALSALADHGHWRKRFLILFSVLGAVVSQGYLMASSLTTLVWITLVSGVCFGTSFVFYYAYLPSLTRYHPSRLAAVELHAGREHVPAVRRVEERVGNGISTHGMAYGYGSGVFVLALCAMFVEWSGQTVTSMQICCGMAGLWWLLFTVIPHRHLRSRPGPPLPPNENYLLYSMKQVSAMIASAPELSQTFRFLIAWFFLSDALTTLVSVSVIYGKSNLHMPDSQLALAALLTPFAALIGSYWWLLVQRRLGLSTKSTMILLSILYAVVPAYGILGFFLPIGLKQAWEVWMVCLYHGLLLGAIQSYSRVMFSELLPEGFESQFFGLYELTDRGSAWIGPLAMAIVADVFHELRYGFIFLFLMFLVSVWALSGVDVQLGQREARRYARREREWMQLEQYRYRCGLE